MLLFHNETILVSGKIFLIGDKLVIKGPNEMEYLKL